MKRWIVPVILILVLAMAGCGKAPAQAALTAADAAIATAKPEVEKYVPEEFGKLTAAAADAKAKFDAGNYKDALAAAQEIPGKATEALKAAKAKKDELTAKWTATEAAMPDTVKGLTDRLASLQGMKKLPNGIDKAQLETAKTTLASVTADWTAATEAFKSGDLMGALTKGDGVKAKSDELAKLLQLAPPPPAPTAAPAK